MNSHLSTHYNNGSIYYVSLFLYTTFVYMYYGTFLHYISSKQCKSLFTYLTLLYFN